MNSKERTQKINKLQKRHPGTTRQRNSHGAGEYSVEFFSKTEKDPVTGHAKLVARYTL